MFLKILHKTLHLVTACFSVKSVRDCYKFRLSSINVLFLIQSTVPPQVCLFAYLMHKSCQNVAQRQSEYVTFNNLKD